MSDGKPLPVELIDALNARSEADVVQQPSPGEITAARRVDGKPARVPLSEASGAAQVSAVSRLVSVLGPSFKQLLGSLLLVGFKVVELTAEEKTQVQAQMLDVAREQAAQKNVAKPSVLKMPPKPRLIRPN